MICNLGCSTNPRDNILSRSVLKFPEVGCLDGASGVVDESLADDGWSSSTCMICGNMISDSPTPSSEHGLANTMTSEADLFSSNDLGQCLSCFTDAIGTMESLHDRGLKFGLGSQPPSVDRAQDYSGSSVRSSTKVKALVRDLKVQRQAAKRSVDKSTCIRSKLANP